jgi:hypothetical protein
MGGRAVVWAARSLSSFDLLLMVWRGRLVRRSIRCWVGKWEGAMKKDTRHMSNATLFRREGCLRSQASTPSNRVWTKLEGISN